ncbi:MAG: glycosyltransferase [bacterium]
MEAPLISVIIPYYRGERFIALALESIFRQKYATLEVIVVNDGSPEESLAVLAPYGDRITLLSQENKGQAAARNLGLKHAKGSIIAFIDQDDLWTDEHIKLLLPHLGNDGYDYAQGVTEIFRIQPDRTREVIETLFHPELLGAALYKREVFNMVGFFDETMRKGEDFDWNIRLRESAAREKRIPEVTFMFRRHENNQTNDRGYVAQGQMASLRKKLARARGQAG